MIRKCFKLILFFLFSAGFLFAEQSPSDFSKEQIFLEHKTYQELLDLSQKEIFKDDYQLSLLFLRLALPKSENSLERAKVFLKIASIYDLRGEIRQAKLLYRQIIQNYSQAEEIVRASKEKLLAR